MIDPAPTMDLGAVARAGELLRLVLADGDEGRPLADYAAEIGVPLSSCYRIVAALRRAGFVAPATRGRLVPGLELLTLAQRTTPQAALIATARPLFRKLARTERATAHLGILEDDMISYIVKEHGGGESLFTREGGQLEAYCSAIGRTLLAYLTDRERDDYLASGPFVSLTERTVTCPDRLRMLLSDVRERGFAVDDREIADDLSCVAVPVHDRAGCVIAAVSLSRPFSPTRGAEPPAALYRCARALSVRLGARPEISGG